MLSKIQLVGFALLLCTCYMCTSKVRHDVDEETAARSADNPEGEIGGYITRYHKNKFASALGIKPTTRITIDLEQDTAKHSIILGGDSDKIYRFRFDTSDGGTIPLILCLRSETTATPLGMILGNNLDTLVLIPKDTLVIYFDPNVSNAKFFCASLLLESGDVVAGIATKTNVPVFAVRKVLELDLTDTSSGVQMSWNSDVSEPVQYSHLAVAKRINFCFGNHKDEQLSFGNERSYTWASLKSSDGYRFAVCQFIGASVLSGISIGSPPEIKMFANGNAVQDAPIQYLFHSSETYSIVGASGGTPGRVFFGITGTDGADKICGDLGNTWASNAGITLDGRVFKALLYSEDSWPDLDDAEYRMIDDQKSGIQIAKDKEQLLGPEWLAPAAYDENLETPTDPSEHYVWTGAEANNRHDNCNNWQDYSETAILGMLRNSAVAPRINPGITTTTHFVGNPSSPFSSCDHPWHLYCVSAGQPNP